MTRDEILGFYRNNADSREQWNRRNGFYHKLLEKYFTFVVPPGKRVLEIGCGSGDLLAAVAPEYGVGIDFAEECIGIARRKYPHLDFRVDDAENLALDETFDYIILSDLLCCLHDAQTAIRNIRRLCRPHTRIVVSQYNFLWEPLIKFLQFAGLKQRQPNQNWFSVRDIENLLMLENFQTVKIDRKILMPVRIPVLSFLANRIFANLPLFRMLDLVSIQTLRPAAHEPRQASVTIVVPARNERGNIENAVKRTPAFGTRQEFIFIEGNSSDGTYGEMERVKAAYPDRDIKLMKQTGHGKGNAVREAFDAASGEILMILDADLTMPPEELPKFYEALCSGKGEFVNGCRLVYPMEQNAMRTLNLMGNKFFGSFFSFLLGQRLKDTLCGTKALYASDYRTVKENRSYFGDFDPFGDFDLLFGAAKQNLKIVEIIIRYRDREYGSTQISRFRHGILLLRMSAFAAKKIKFI